MTEPKPHDIYILPSGARVIIHRKQLNESYACLYVDEAGALLSGRALAPGVTLTGEFLGLRCTKVA